MGWFSPYKRHANAFNYTPRYYDPVKEAREQRRREMRGEDSTSSEEEGNDKEYSPGQYIRAQRAARRAGKFSGGGAGGNGGGRRNSMLVGLAFVILIVLFVWLIYPMIYRAFNDTEKTMKEGIEQQDKMNEKEFDPSAPITIVPNDYVEPQTEQ